MFFCAGFAAHWRSLKEILIILVISTSPLYLGALLHHYIDEGSPSYLLSLLFVVQRGELFLYSMSIVAAIVLLANNEWISELWDHLRRNRQNDPPEADGAKAVTSDNDDRPPKWLFNVFSIVTFGICSMFFGIESVKFKIPSGNLVTLSSVIFGLSIVFWYVINVLSTVDPPNIEVGLDADARKLGDRLRRLRGRHGRR